MEDKNKTKDQLIRELVDLRQRLSELESVATKQKVEAESLGESREIDLEKLKKQAQSILEERLRIQGAMGKRQKQIRVLAHALESCPQPLAVAHPDGRMMTYNAAFCKLTGYSKDEMHGVRFFSDLSPKSWHSIIKEAAEKIRRTKKSQQFENEFVRKDGKRVLVETSAHPIYDSEGNLQHFYYFFRDVDERKHLENALVASEALSRAIVENSPTQTTIVDHEARVVCSNLSEAGPGESVQNIVDVIFKDNAGGIGIEMHRELMRCMKSGIPKEFPEQECDDKFLRIKISPFSGGAIITSVDVTKQRLMASSLKENEERFRVVADFANYWEFWIGKDGNHVYVSPSCERITGYRPEEFQRDPKLLKEIIHPDDRALMGVHLGEDFERPEPKHLDFRILKRGGEERWILHLCQPVYGAGGRFLGRRASNRDCTESKRIERLLQSRTAELDQITNELSQYGNVFSSDLRAPLRAIRNYTDFLREELGEPVGDAQRAYLDGLAHATIEAGALLEDLSVFSRIAERDEPIETVQLGTFLRELITTLDVPTDVKLVLEDDWPTLEVQPNLLRQIFQNLVDNALKFNTSSQKFVEIGWRSTEDESYEIHVRDNGIGIQPRHADQVFGVFERLHTLEEYEGNGMGLAVVKKATLKLGGSVRLISKPGEGSTFFVTLPRSQKQRRRH